ncbi:MAG TPA: hypothetical protein VKS21_04345, partial [Spirochaetota bacterium]|nr:hypothetical protein [Spirochaetota bacterium]
MKKLYLLGFLLFLITCKQEKTVFPPADQWLAAVCYSPYRNGQSPEGNQPGYNQIKEDLLLIAKEWRLIRVYGSGSTTGLILKVIQQENINLRLMLGIWLQ